VSDDPRIAAGRKLLPHLFRERDRNRLLVRSMLRWLKQNDPSYRNKQQHGARGGCEVPETEGQGKLGYEAEIESVIRKLKYATYFLEHGRVVEAEKLIEHALDHIERIPLDPATKRKSSSKPPDERS
jgi:hypothetical protein